MYLVIRGDDLYKNMSSYLAQRIEQTPNIEVLCNTEIRRMSGDGHLGEVEIVNNKTGEVRTLKDPGGVQLHRGGAADRLAAPGDREGRQGIRPDAGRRWHSRPTGPPQRQPFLLETSRPGVFAAGDVRSGSVKRVASAVGEGAMAVQFVHEYLKEM